jgi:hypothetical protein
MRKLRLLISALCALVLLGGGLVSAAEPQSTRSLPPGISVSPALAQVRLTEGQNEAQFDLQITNNTDVQVQVKINFNDFKALNESGGIAFLGKSATELQKSHGLTNWVQLGTQQLGLNPGQTQTVAVKLVDLKSLPPGGHYGAVTYQVLKAVPNGPGNKVTINQVLTSLVFLVTAGGGTQNLSLHKPTVHGVQFRIPSHLDLLFTATGNTQTAPRGNVVIYRGDPEQPVATGILNPEGALVLPGSNRLLPTTLTTLGTPWWPHRYHVRIQYRPDSATRFQTYDASFLYINPWAVVLTPLIAVLAAYALLWLRRNQQKVLPLLRAAPIVVKKQVRAGARKTRKVIHRKQG